MWDFCKRTIRTARKAYRCGAGVWIGNCNLSEYEFGPEDWATIQSAISEGVMILPGTKYLECRGK